MRQPHIALFLELTPRLRLATTVGLAERPAPVPSREGLASFELCAITTFHDPQLLWLLSNVGMHMLDASSALLPYETIQLGGDDTRMLLVPRWKLRVPNGPSVDVVEPLPITDAQWSELAPTPREERGTWVASMGPRTVEAWTMLFERFGD